MIIRKPTPTLYLSTPSPDTSPRCSTIFSDCDADDEDAMSTDENMPPSRPLSFHQAGFLPIGPYCPRVPTLHEILTNQAPPPWTLAAFTAHLHQNHCLENLEFMKDAERYRKKHEALGSVVAAAPLSPLHNEQYNRVKEVRMLWQKLLDAYIVPNAPREVNLPADVRDALLSLPNHSSPPSPDELEPAVKRIYELMDESVMMTFINELSPTRATASINEDWEDSEERITKRASDEGPRHRSRSRRKTSPSQSQDNTSALFNDPGLRTSQTLGNNKSVLATYISNSSTGSGDAILTDGSGSPLSPTNSPMTPPTTPPSSELGGTSPRARNDNAFRKMMGRLGSKKKSASRMDRVADD